MTGSLPRVAKTCSKSTWWLEPNAYQRTLSSSVRKGKRGEQNGRGSEERTRSFINPTTIRATDPS